MSASTQQAVLDEVFQRLQAAYSTVVDSDDPLSVLRAKAQLSAVALELSRAVQLPHEAATLFAMHNAVHPCFRAAGDCGILSSWPKETMTASELANKTGADVVLIGLSTCNMCVV
jgi:hypothetical protein